MRVLLGPSHELHAGIHGALTDEPVPGVEYLERTYSIYFQHEEQPHRAFSPVHDHSQCEWLRFEDEKDGDLVHSARFPVDTLLPWVVDADCLLLPLQFGGFFALGVHSGVPVPDEARIRRREAFMLARYAEPGCARIILRSERARLQFLQRVGENDLVDGGTREALAAKAQVVYPAVAASPRVERWEPLTPSILFMGRTFVDKGGLLAVAVLERLRSTFGRVFSATVVATCPPAAAERLQSIGVDVQPTMPRNGYLNRLAQADIFFSPTLFESFGMGLVEAAAAGTAIVTSSGPGMEHIGELFKDGQEALLVSNALGEEARVTAYVEAIGALIRDPSLRRTLASGAHALATRGRLSLARHHRDMSDIYDAALRCLAPASVGARPSRSRPRFSDASRVLRWSEKTCHWARQWHVPAGGLRICL